MSETTDKVTPLKKLIRPHQYLLLALLLGLGVQLLIYMLVMRPQKERLQELSDGIGELRSSMSGGKWPMDSEVLQRHLSELNKEIKQEGSSKGEGRKASRLNRARELMGKTFQGNIEGMYGTVAQFMEKATRLEYQSEYDRVVKDLGNLKVQLEPEVLGIGADSQGIQNYQMLMRIWTVEKLCKLARKNELSVCLHQAAPDAKGGRRGRQFRPVSHVVSYDARGYYELPLSEAPYLIDFPVELDVEGTLEACKEYLHALDSGGVCMPPVHYELLELPPKKKPGKDELWVGPVRMRLVCVSFLVPEYNFKK